MTIKEFYEWARENHYEEAEICVEGSLDGTYLPELNDLRIKTYRNGYMEIHF